MRGLSSHNEIPEQIRDDEYSYANQVKHVIVPLALRDDNLVSNAYCKNLFPYSLVNLFTSEKAAFTLAEVLITLGIIGIIAAITIPALISGMNDFVYKNAYKVAFNDVNQAFRMMQANGESLKKIVYNINEEGQPIVGYSPDYGENFKLLAKYFRSTKTCFDKVYGDICWKCKGCEQANVVTADEHYKGTLECTGEYAFVDARGRNWIMYSNNEKIFLVDTNGFAGPNMLGKDRFPFSFSDSNGYYDADSASATFITPHFRNDITYSTRWCPSGKCYYISWLFDRSRY